MNFIMIIDIIMVKTIIALIMMVVIMMIMFNLYLLFPGEAFDYLVAHGRMKENEARAKLRQVGL